MDVGSDVEDDSIASAYSSNRQGAQLHLAIPARMMLDEMLRQLGLPLAHYHQTVYGDHKTCVTVICHTTKPASEGPHVPMKISGIRSIDVRMAEHSAAVAAVRLIETATNTVIRDLNHNRLEHLRAENISLKSQLKRAHIKCQKLARGWFLSVRFICSFSSQFHNLAILSYFGGQEVISSTMKTTFANIEGIAQRLRSRGTRLEKKLEQIRRCP